MVFFEDKASLNESIFSIIEDLYSISLILFFSEKFFKKAIHYRII